MDTADCTRCPHLDRFGRCVAAGKMVEDLRKCPPAVGVEAVKAAPRKRGGAGGWRCVK